MIKLLATTILGLSILGSGSTSFIAQQINVEPQNEIHIQMQTENLTSIQWHNNQFSLSNDEASLNLFEEYSINIDEAQRSSDIYIQEEYIPFEEIVPIEYINTNSDISLMDLDTPQEQEFVHNKGYIKFITKAYAIGFYDGNIVYHIEVSTEQLKEFILNRHDNLIIRHGNNAVALNHQSLPAKGERITPVTIHNDFLEPISADEREELSPNYSCASGGVYYTFTVSGSSMGDSSSVIYGHTIVTADYYMVATDTTAVQPVYVHNQNWFVESLSISFGPIGASISTGVGTDVMEGTTMTLKGYSNRINQTPHKMNPVDWKFDARYYFENEGIRTTTKIKDDFTISTKRLRCGYIEEQYINLSPNRLNAGDAYLELTFNKPVYEFKTYLAFWSASEGLNVSNGDYAYIQYLDEDGNWETCVDLLGNENLPTNRATPKLIEREFIKGIYGIRFVAHKNTPLTDRNKGRICIGEITFITCEID